MGLGKCIKIICVHHYGIIHSNFTSLKILYVPSLHHSLSPTPGNHWSFYSFHSFHNFPEYYKHTHMHTVIQYVALSDRFFHLVICILVSSMSFHGLLIHFFLCWIVSHCLDMHQFIHLLTEGHLDCVQVLAAMNKVSVNICVQVCCADSSFQLWILTSTIEGARSQVRVSTRFLIVLSVARSTHFLEPPSLYQILPLRYSSNPLNSTNLILKSLPGLPN